MRIFGHLIHPMLVHFPVAFWTLGTLFDIGAYAGWPDLWQPAGLLILLGLGLGLISAIVGGVDFALMEADDQARSTAEIHMMLMLGAWMIYLVAYLFRLEGTAITTEASMVPVILSILGFLTMSVGGRYGGHLVYHHGVGVAKRASPGASAKTGANKDAG